MSPHLKVSLADNAKRILCVCVCVCSNICLTFQKFLQAAPHYVNVFDANELEADVGVVVLVFIAFTCGAVG